MKKYLVLATVFMMSSYAQAATMTWYGSAGWKYSKASQNDGTTNSYPVGQLIINSHERQEKSHLFRGEIGATGGWDNVEWGVGVRTSGTALLATPGTATVNTDWQAANNGAGFAPTFNRAWFKYGNDWGFGDIGLVFGRQAPAFAVGQNQVFIDKDVNFDGIAQTWHWGSFGLNLAQYILGANDGAGVATGDSSYMDGDSARDPNSPAGLGVLYAFQPTFKWKFSDEMSALFAVGYYKWANTIGTNYHNRIPNGQLTGFGLSAAAMGANGAVFNTATSQENSAQWQGLMQWQFPFMIGLEAEFVMNKDQAYAPVKVPGGMDNFPTPKIDQDETALSIGVSYGQLKKAHDFMIGYTYHNKGIGSVHGRYSDDLIAPGMQAHAFSAAYNIANNFHVGGKVISMDEKNGKGVLGADVGKKLETNYFEINSGVKF